MKVTPFYISDSFLVTRLFFEDMNKSTYLVENISCKGFTDWHSESEFQTKKLSIFFSSATFEENSFFNYLAVCLKSEPE